jgi:hypothetical protein
MPLVVMRGFCFESDDRNALEKKLRYLKVFIEQLERQQHSFVFCSIRTNEFCHCARVPQMRHHKKVSRCPDSFRRKMSILYICQMEAICTNFRAEDVCCSLFDRQKAYYGAFVLEMLHIFCIHRLHGFPGTKLSDTRHCRREREDNNRSFSICAVARRASSEHRRALIAHFIFVPPQSTHLLFYLQ